MRCETRGNEGIIRWIGARLYLLSPSSCNSPAVLVPCAENARRCSGTISLCSPAKISRNGGTGARRWPKFIRRNALGVKPRPRLAEHLIAAVCAESLGTSRQFEIISLRSRNNEDQAIQADQTRRSHNRAGSCRTLLCGTSRYPVCHATTENSGTWRQICGFARQFDQQRSFWIRQHGRLSSPQLRRSLLRFAASALTLAVGPPRGKATVEHDSPWFNFAGDYPTLRIPTRQPRKSPSGDLQRSAAAPTVTLLRARSSLPRAAPRGNAAASDS